MGALDVNKVVHRQQWWLFITCSWLQGGVFQLLANMLSLLVTGYRLEQDFGFVRIAMIYAISGVGGSLLSSLFIQTNISVGASGALFGLLGAMLFEIGQYMLVSLEHFYPSDHHHDQFGCGNTSHMHMWTTLLTLEDFFQGFSSAFCFLAGPSLDGLTKDILLLDMHLLKLRAGFGKQALHFCFISVKLELSHFPF